MEETFAKTISDSLPEKKEESEKLMKLATAIIQIVIGLFVIVIFSLIILLILCLTQLSLEKFMVLIVIGCMFSIVLVLLWMIGASTTVIINEIIEKKSSNKE